MKQVFFTPVNPSFPPTAKIFPSFNFIFDIWSAATGMEETNVQKEEGAGTFPNWKSPFTVNELDKDVEISPFKCVRLTPLELTYRAKGDPLVFVDTNNAPAGFDE